MVLVKRWAFRTLSLPLGQTVPKPLGCILLAEVPRPGCAGGGEYGSLRKLLNLSLLTCKVGMTVSTPGPVGIEMLCSVVLRV